MKFTTRREFVSSKTIGDLGSYNVIPGADEIAPDGYCTSRNTMQHMDARTGKNFPFVSMGRFCTLFTFVMLARRMNMNPLWFACCMAVLAGAGNVAIAQENLGQLLDEGAKRLSGPELRAALVGATVIGPTPTGTQSQIEIKPDGKASGTIATTRGIIRVNGTWDITDDGKLCVKYQFTVAHTGMSIPDYEGCGFYFIDGEHYFVSSSDTNRGVAALPRTIKR